MEKSQAAVKSDLVHHKPGADNDSKKYITVVAKRENQATFCQPETENSARRNTTSTLRRAVAEREMAS